MNAAALHQSEPAITVAVSAERITTVDPLDLTVTVTAGANLGAPVFDPPLAQALEAAGWTVTAEAHRPIGIASEPGVLRYVTDITIEPFLDGTYEIPALTATFDAVPALPAISSQARIIDVRSVLPEAPEQRSEAQAQVDPGAFNAPALPDQPAFPLPIALAIGAAVAATAGAAAALALRAARSKPEDPLREAERALDAAPFNDATRNPCAISRALRQSLQATTIPRATSMTHEELAAALSRMCPETTARAAAVIDAIAMIDDARFSGAAPSERPLEPTLNAARAAARRLITEARERTT